DAGEHYELKTFSQTQMKKNNLYSLVVALTLAAPGIASAETPARIFSKPEDAVAALKQAAANFDTNAMNAIFGSTAGLVNPDRVQATNDIRKFLDAFAVTNHLDRESPTNYTLEVGSEAWPFPVPIVKVNGGWVFDADEGREEIINRRIGRNELDVL